MTVNVHKSNIVQFRNPSVRKTDFTFRCGCGDVITVDKYTYLGILLSEHLDYELTAKVVVQSAKKGKRKVQGVPQSKTAAHPRQEEE